MSEDVLPLLRSFLIERYEQIKRSLTIKLGNVDLASDALHETWLRLQRSGGIDGPIRSPQAYLLRMSVNVAIDILRSQSQLLSTEDVQSVMDELPDPTPSPAQAAEDRSQMKALNEILMHMAPRRREILLLVRLEGWAQQDVAKKLNISLRTVEYELKAAQDHCAMRLGRNADKSQ
jgi:RNA polymerase sigma factor (sigma-70 family)